VNEPLDRILFRSDLLTIGAFRAGPGHPRFHDSGPIRRHIFVFPRTSVVIRHDGRPAFATDTRVVTYYNRGQRYTRRALDERGDRCEWFAPRGDVLREILARHDPAADERPEAPFPYTHGPSDAGCYLLQRQVVRHLVGADEPDAMAVEEASFHVLERLTGLAMEGHPPAHESRVVAADGPGSTAGGAGRRPPGPVRRARLLLAERFAEPLTLEEIAEQAGASVFHLCRLFRRWAGTTVHRHRNELRLRASLEPVAGGSDLTRVALELGYSSHSHFTAAFRTAFGVTPSAFRATASSRRIRELAGQLARPVDAR